MATEKELHELIGRAVADEEFRALLLDDPVKAARGLGLDLSEEQVAGLLASDLLGMAEGLDLRLSKRTGAGVHGALSGSSSLLGSIHGVIE